MPTIDISQYPKKKQRTPVPISGENKIPNIESISRSADGQGEKASGLIALLNRDISFGSSGLGDKKKESLYLELSSLLQAGINLKAAFELILADQEKPKDKALFVQVQRDVISGMPFSQALGASGRFSLYEVYSLQIGEETGKLLEVLHDLAKYYQNKIRQRRKIVSALTYPCIVLATSLSAVFFMLKFIVPMFGDVFRRFGGHLPWITERIIGVSKFLENNFYKGFILATLIGVFIFSARKTLWFRKHSARILLQVPLVGNLVQKIYLARFCNSMRLLISARLPLLRALTLIRQMIGFHPIEDSLDKVEAGIMAGKTLHQSLADFPVYPAKMIQLLRVGEETNQLEYFFGRISEQYVEEVEYKTSTLSSVMEPLIIIFLGLVVGLILVSMYLPLFQMSNSF